MLSFGEHGLWPYKDYAGVDDFAEIWWDPTARGPDEFGEVGLGLWQFADGGRRYPPGKWPTGKPHAFVKKRAITMVGD